MEKQLYFKGVKYVGDLYLKYVFLEFEGSPIIFVCTDKKNNFYLCQCSEIRGLSRWIIAKTTYVTIEQLVKKEIDIYTAIKMNGKRKCIYELYVDKSTACKVLNFDKIDELFLPEKNVLLEYADDEEVKKFLNDEKLVLKNTYTFFIDDDFSEVVNNKLYKNFFSESELADDLVDFVSAVEEQTFDSFFKDEYKNEKNISFKELNLAEAA